MINTAAALLHRTELSAEEVRGALKDMLAGSSPLPLSEELQKLIGMTELIESTQMARLPGPKTAS
jgi:hypothetical protein